MKNFSIFAAAVVMSFAFTATPVHAAALSGAQIQSILTLLSAFGTDAKIIAQVSSTLNGGATNLVPTCTLSAKPYMLVAGESTKLSWSTTDAKTVKWQQDNSANVLGLSSAKLRKNGSETAEAAGKGSQTATLLVTSKDGSTGSCSTTLVIE